jgi:hypothetical protein
MIKALTYCKTTFIIIIEKRVQPKQKKEGAKNEKLRRILHNKHVTSYDFRHGYYAGDR